MNVQPVKLATGNKHLDGKLGQGLNVEKARFEDVADGLKIVLGFEGYNRPAIVRESIGKTSHYKPKKVALSGRNTSYALMLPYDQKLTKEVTSILNEYAQVVGNGKVRASNGEYYMDGGASDFATREVTIPAERENQLIKNLAKFINTQAASQGPETLEKITAIQNQTIML